MEEGFIKIIFVKSEENLGDGFTKNIFDDIYERHIGNFINGLMDEQMGEDEGDLETGKAEKGTKVMNEGLKNLFFCLFFWTFFVSTKLCLMGRVLNIDIKTKFS